MNSYSGAPANSNICSWDPNHEQMRKGITLAKEKLVQLESVLWESLVI